jgi:hypothetical protein
MRRHLVGLAVAALTFSMGGVGYLLLGLSDEVYVSEPPALTAFKLEAAPAEPTETCELHGVAMRIECVPFSAIFHLMSLTKATVKIHSFPNSHRSSFGWCKPPPEPSLFTFVCPKCRAAEAEWDRQVAANLADLLGGKAPGR